MTDSFSFFFAFLIFIGFFFLSVKKGVLSILSSGLAAASAMAVFFVGVKFVPDLAFQFAEIEIEWKKAVYISGGAALFVFLVVRILGGFALKSMLGPEGFLHSFVDGTSGGILSLFPSFVIVILLFTCIRISGTLHELNYAASLSRDKVDQMAEQIPSYPWTSVWRDSVEDIPFMGPILDSFDPFSNRVNRNAGAFAIMNQSSLIRSHLLSQPDSAKLAASEKIIKVNQDPGVHEALKDHDRIKLVFTPAIREIAKDPELRPLLERVQLQPILKGYVKKLKSAGARPE